MCEVIGGLSAYISRPARLRSANHGEGSGRKRSANLGDSGATLVETAVSASILIVMLIGMMQTALALYTYLFVSDAAREATRYAMVRGSISCTNTPDLKDCSATSAEIQTFLRTRGYPGLTASDLTATTTWLTLNSGTPATWSSCSSGTCNAPGNSVKVKVRYKFPVSIPFVPSSTLTLSSTSQMVISQ
jgi:Flp pilus assembly protein TadG